MFRRRRRRATPRQVENAEQERPYDLGSMGRPRGRARRTAGDTAGDCCAEAACEGACSMLSLTLVGQTLLAGCRGLRDPAALPGRSRTARAAVGAIRVYQHRISPTRPPCCRFTPTCSAYAAQAIVRHGALRGGFQTARRLRRCGDRRAPGGADPVR